MVNIQHEEKGEVLVVRLSGRLDAITSPGVETALFEQIRAGKHRLLLNMSAIDYLSSGGMRMLLSVSKKLKSLEGHLVICGLIPTVLEVLKMSGFDQILEISQTEDEGWRRF